MTNEELVTLIQTGERDRLEELWAQVKPLACRIAYRWQLAMEGRGGVTTEDLEQHGFIAMLAAVERFDLSVGNKFSTYYVPCLKTEFLKAFGLATKRQQMDPIHSAESLDAPLTDDPDADTLVCFLADPKAELVFDEMEDKERSMAVKQALQSLPDLQRNVIILRFWFGCSLEQTGKILGVARVTAANLESRALLRLRHPVNSQKLRGYV